MSKFALGAVAVLCVAFVAVAWVFMPPHTRCANWSVFPTGKTVILICTRYAK